MNYESPINIISQSVQNIHGKIEGEVMKMIYSYGISIDRDELLKALAYDREQYTKGYIDAMRGKIRCADCDHYLPCICKFCGTVFKPGKSDFRHYRFQDRISLFVLCPFCDRGNDVKIEKPVYNADCKRKEKDHQ